MPFCLKKEPSEDDYKPPNYLNANFLSRLTQWYISPLMRRGYKKQLTQEDLPDVLPSDSSLILAEELDKLWVEEKKREKPSLARACTKLFQYSLYLACVSLLIEEAGRIAQPVLVSYLVDYFQGKDVSNEMACVYATILALLTFFNTLFHAFTFHITWNLGMRCRAAAGSLIFRKMMTASTEDLSKTSSGTILNYISTDIEKFQTVFILSPYLVTAPITAIVTSGLLFREFGLAFLAGLLSLFACAALQNILARLSGKMRLRIASWGDKRTHLMKELIAGMRGIKLYCWESQFSGTIGRLRKNEMKSAFIASIMDIQRWNLNIVSIKLVTFFTIITYVLLNNELTPQKIFILLGWMENLRFAVFVVFSQAIMFALKAYYSSKRIQEFLMVGDEQNSTDERKESESLYKKDVATGEILIDNMKAHWNTVEGLQKEVFSLRANCHVNQGQLVAVIGHVGCGKSSLLLAILNQMPIIGGVLLKRGSIAYVPQDAWVFSGSVRENILFGEEMRTERYEQTIKMCSLAQDIAGMPKADQTLVGEKGLSLSGGQKARINLARAVYRDADIYLLDDPLSAVDTKVGKQLFHNCIRGQLEGKTRLLVTHQVQYLKDVDEIIILKEGDVFASGTYDELAGKVDFSSFLVDEKHRRKSQSSMESSCLGESEQSDARRVSTSSADDINSAIISTESKEEQVEDTHKGSVSFGVYAQYFKAGNVVALAALFIVLMCLDRAAYILIDWWLAKWADWYLDDYPGLTNRTDDSSLPPESRDYLFVYVGLLVILIVLGLGETSVFAVSAAKASRRLHTQMFNIVMHAPMVFFERRPVGQVLNRFTRDTGFMDDPLPQQSYIFISALMTFVSTAVFIIAVNPYALLPIVPVLVIGIALRQYCLRTIRDVKRIEAMSRSPVYSHITAVLQGMSVIRAYGMENPMVKTFDQLQDQYTANWVTFISCYRWLGLRIDWINVAYLIGVIFVGMIFSDQLNGTMFGLGLTYIIVLLGFLQFIVRISSEVESYMTSVERILEYTGLEQEAPAHLEEPSIPPEWPSNGEITFDHTSLTYLKDAEPALTEICISIMGGQKIGVVGRTGAGKSSLIAAVMRLTEPEGSIWIDGIDITKIGLLDLREKISVIPQDPVLFSATLRRNLDPFSSYTDKQIWDVIDEVELREKVESLPGQLFSDVTEGGENFSVGQKQLLCLARALLRQNKIIMVDEATANVDQRTDALIQRTLRSKFGDCTVLTIAHRLNTIIECDKVLVMNRGRVEQFGQPFKLLQDKEGILYEMVKHSGPKHSKELMEVAELKFNHSARESALHLQDINATLQSGEPSNELGNAACSSD